MMANKKMENFRKEGVGPKKKSVQVQEMPGGLGGLDDEKGSRDRQWVVLDEQKDRQWVGLDAKKGS